MTIKKIIKTLLHPTTIKIVTVICIVGFFFILPTFAQTDTTSEALKNIQKGLHTFISLCSRFRVILAILAGKLMTNDFVYGGFLHLDVYLRKIRNIMKNFANFALIALVLGSIIKNLIGKEAMDIKKIITNTLVAGILIQASRFLMGAVIDLSTVATAGISSFPMSFLKNDPGLKNTMNDAISIFKSERYSVDLDNMNNIKSIPISGGTQSNEDLRENVVPSYNSVSGPFIYLGMGVFNFQNYLKVGDSITVKDLTLTFALRFFMLFFFTIGLLLLFIANIMRVGLLRIFIIGAPFLILIQLFKLKTEGAGGIGKIFSLSNLAAIVFKPVIFVIGMSLMLIVIVSMERGMMSSGASRESDLNGVRLGLTGANKETSTLTIDGITNIEVDQKGLLGADVLDKTKNIFSQIIILLLELFLMRWFVKLSLTIGGGPIEKTMENLLKQAESMAKSLPILPLAGGASVTTASSIMSKNSEKMLGGFGMNKAGEFGEMDKSGKYFTTNEAKFKNRMDTEVLGLPSQWMPADYNQLDLLTGDKYDTFFTESVELAKKRQGGLSITGNPDWFKSLKKILLNSDNRAFKLGFSGPLQNTDDATIKTYFDNPKNAGTLYNLLGGNTGGVPAGTPIPKKYEELEKITFWPNTQK